MPATRRGASGIPPDQPGEAPGAIEDRPAGSARLQWRDERRGPSGLARNDREIGGAGVEQRHDADVGAERVRPHAERGRPPRGLDLEKREPRGLVGLDEPRLALGDPQLRASLYAGARDDNAL